MRRFAIVFLCFCITSVIYAGTTTLSKNNMPEGTFKKQSNGKFVQYDKNGKKIGTYKLTHGRFVRIK